MARILKNVLETWGNLLLLKQYKLQYYWARPELWERFWRLEETCYWSHANYSIIVSSQNIEKYFGDLRKLVVTEAVQTTVLMSSARIPRRILEIWGNLLLMNPCKLQYYWARPEYWKRSWRLEDTCCYWSHANNSFIELGQNTEKDFGDLRKPVVSEVKQTTVLLSSARILRRDLETWGKLVVTEAMQTTVLLSSARILRRFLEAWANLLLLKPCKLQYYWARPEYWEETWRFEETCCYWSHANYNIIEPGQNTEK